MVDRVIPTHDLDQTALTWNLIPPQGSVSYLLLDPGRGKMVFRIFRKTAISTIRLKSSLAGPQGFIPNPRWWCCKTPVVVCTSQSAHDIFVVLHRVDILRSFMTFLHVSLLGFVPPLRPAVSLMSDPCWWLGQTFQQSFTPILFRCLPYVVPSKALPAGPETCSRRQ